MGNTVGLARWVICIVFRSSTLFLLYFCLIQAGVSVGSGRGWIQAVSLQVDFEQQHLMTCML